MTHEQVALSVALEQAAPIPLDVSFSCRAGELLALIGPSGSGKTTVLRAIAGLYRPASGRIVAGGDVWLDTARNIDATPQARRVGLVFQDYALFPHLSALDNVRLAMQERAEPEKTRLAQELLERVHLEGLHARRPDQLSGGQRQRVAIARALARDPSVLLLDEPFSAVDRITREPLKDELAALHRNLSIPIVLVTHDLDEAQALADRLCVLHAGKTLQTGTPDELRTRPASALVARLMGDENLAPARVTAADQVELSGVPLRVERVAGFAVGQEVSLLVPPESIAFADRGAGSANVVDARIVGLQSLGELIKVTAALDRGGQRLSFRRSRNELTSRNLSIGQNVALFLQPDALHLMPAEPASDQAPTNRA